MGRGEERETKSLKKSSSVALVGRALMASRLPLSKSLRKGILVLQVGSTFKGPQWAFLFFFSCQRKRSPVKAVKRLP